MKRTLRIVLAAFCSLPIWAQVYSPKLLREGQPDSSDLQKFAASIYAHAHAGTSREKAEAIWRFFQTDGRFVAPGYWYHIAGWTYEEPTGEVLDPIKLLNSYGFGLCYHIAPLLEAVFEAGGLDARCWFLTGHTVAEVFYEGRFHYFDSDMMGYNVAGVGPFQGKPVVGVRELESDSSIILDKLAAPNRVKPGTVDHPWYPADVNASAMGGLAELFTTTKDNYIYPYTRYAPGHKMDLVLRPGEKLIRYFAPEEPGLFYLPYKYDGKKWTEFPQEIAEYHIRTADGPRSQKDARLWATGRIEYAPPAVSSEKVVVIDMPSPYVIIDAHFRVASDLGKDGSIKLETSVDGGQSWSPAGEHKGPCKDSWTAEPAVLVHTTHGRLTAVSGSYGYKLRINKTGAARVESLTLISRIELNPRSLPSIESGDNVFTYFSEKPLERVALPLPLAAAQRKEMGIVDQQAQPFLLPEKGNTGEAIYELNADGRALAGFDAGARFLDMRDGLAPDKLTAEVRKSGITTQPGEASLAWSLSRSGPFTSLWEYAKQGSPKDIQPQDQLLRWPEVYRSVRDLPADTRRIYIRLRSSGPAIDSPRFAVYLENGEPSGGIEITQRWKEQGVLHEHTERFPAGAAEHQFRVRGGQKIENVAVIFAAH